MTAYKDLKKEELMSLKEQLSAEYQKVKEKGLKLDMSRGKPAIDQLDLSNALLERIGSQEDFRSASGLDVRNYGALDGILEAKELMAGMLEVDPEEVIVCGNSSLSIMYDTIARSMTHGVLENEPWSHLDKVRFLCPVPGYDRHFFITEYFGIEMIPIPMNEEGPNMDMVEQFVSEDEAVKGIWCVPKYANPSGITYSDAVVKRFANLKPAAKDFRIFWDNAYAIHHLYEDRQDTLLNIMEECKKANNPDIVYCFGSTSKISFAGAGIGAMASSKTNIESIKKQMAIQTIGYDKINQLRHARFFKDIKGLNAHMKLHADLIRPKFEVVLESLEKELEPLQIAKWTKPNGGYFISLDTLEGCAKKVVSMCKEAGVVMTDAGATYPYGKDPKDSNIRIAPTFPSVEELKQACEVFVLCVKLASVEKYLETR